MTNNHMQDMIKIKIVKREDPNKKIGKHPVLKYRLWPVALISVIFLFFSFSYMFSSADITINPKWQDVTIEKNFSAVKNSNSSPISFDLVVISGEEKRTVETEEKRNIEVPSRGKAVIYNNFSSVPQTLDIDTRLLGSNGKIYKTEKKIVVPGRGKDGKPGAVEVGIYASSPGVEYDSPPLDFNIVGFKDTPKYGKFYGRSNGEISGGVKGNLYVISESKKGEIVNSLKNSLKEKLLKKASEQIPKGFILFDKAVFLNVGDTNVASFSPNPQVPLKLEGTLYGFLFEEAELTKKIAEEMTGGYDGSDVYIPNIKNLGFSLFAQAGFENGDNLSFAEMKNINFTLKGEKKIVWKFNSEKLKKDLLGKDKKDFNLIISQYPNVLSADMVLKPFWRMSFPNKAKNINITVNYPE